MREKLLENIQDGLNESISLGNIFKCGRDIDNISNNTQALHDIAKHVEPFKQFSPEELEVLHIAFASLHISMTRKENEKWGNTFLALWKELKGI